MKHFLITLFLTMSYLVNYSQTQLTQEEFNKLPIEVQNQIKSVQTNSDIETAGKWIGLGKEVGTAVNESLQAVTKTAIDFSETRLGKITMILVIYKIIGSDIIQFSVGILFLIVGLSIALFIHVKYAKPTKNLKSKKYNSETKSYDREWECYGGDSNFAIAAIIIAILSIIISSVIIGSI